MVQACGVTYMGADASDAFLTAVADITVEMFQPVPCPQPSPGQPGTRHRAQCRG